MSNERKRIAATGAAPGFGAAPLNSQTHTISTRLAFREEFFEDLSTRFAISFIARSGRPYSLTFTGGGIFNDSASGFENALAYLPRGLNAVDPNVSPDSTISAGAFCGEPAS